MKWTDRYRKAVTFSYDDGVVQDERLVALLNRYGLKCTFNVNMGVPAGVSTYVYKSVDVVRLDPASLPRLYRGHEAAVHSYTHPNLTTLPPDKIRFELATDKTHIERLFGNPVVGMAYPFGGYDAAVVSVLRELGIRYARTVESSHRFDRQSDLLRFRPTCHHRDPQLPQLVREFLADAFDQPRILYIWGHSYEFDGDGDWERIEALFGQLSGRDDIFYGTNAQVLLDEIRG